MMGKLPQGDFFVELGKRWKDSFKEFVYHSMIWEELGFTYVGPVDGHDVRAMIDAFRAASKVDGPVFVHVVTQKGQWLHDPAKTDRRARHMRSPPR